MLSTVRKLLPWLTPSFNIVYGHLYDCKRFIKFNSNNNYRGSKKKFEAILRRKYHGLEKAFSLPNVKPVFGLESAIIFVQDLEYYCKKYKNEELEIICHDMLGFYIDYIEESVGTSNEVDSFKDLKLCYNKVSLLLDEKYSRLNKADVGVNLLARDKVHTSSDGLNFEAFVNSRFSVRDFSQQPVRKEKIIEAIRIALRTPSVCNRQAWNARLYIGSPARHILRFQHGNRGFGDSVPAVILITASLTSFANNERNQAYVDGGLFSMSLIYALHSKNIGCCPLNTAYSVSKEKELHANTDIDEDEVPIMMLAVGELKDSYYVAKSVRKDIDDVLLGIYEG